MRKENGEAGLTGDGAAWCVECARCRQDCRRQQASRGGCEKPKHGRSWRGRRWGDVRPRRRLPISCLSEQRRAYGRTDWLRRESRAHRVRPRGASARAAFQAQPLATLRSRRRRCSAVKRRAQVAGCDPARSGSRAELADSQGGRRARGRRWLRGSRLRLRAARGGCKGCTRWGGERGMYRRRTSAQVERTRPWRKNESGGVRAPSARRWNWVMIERPTWYDELVLHASE